MARIYSEISLNPTRGNWTLLGITAGLITGFGRDPKVGLLLLLLLLLLASRGVLMLLLLRLPIRRSNLIWVTSWANLPINSNMFRMAPTTAGPAPAGAITSGEGSAEESSRIFLLAVLSPCRSCHGWLCLLLLRTVFVMFLY
ncbi:unnamed protein product [Meganyctiphanes norvegica]|uniref:Uncharacterized protein n=1 Tax=Meganyctiphanes norvegica TaxID=48144 RepID=A0AAV2RUA8_MEGNR